MAIIENVIPNGSTVITKIGDIEAIVIGICVRGIDNGVMDYNIAYFVNGEYKTAWVNSFEITRKVDNSKPMGFAQPSNNQLLKE